jgi:hypothetical protein
MKKTGIENGFKQNRFTVLCNHEVSMSRYTIHTMEISCILMLAHGAEYKSSVFVFEFYNSFFETEMPMPYSFKLNI